MRDRETITGARPFDLFLSYASRDAVVPIGGRRFPLVRVLKKALESHRVADSGTGTRRRFRVCTYTDDFELAPSVREAIRRRLEQSASLLVVCSRAARESNHVRFEFESFASLPGTGARVIVAAVLDLTPEEAFPARFPGGTLGIDLAAEAGFSAGVWARKIRRESHKAVARVLGVALEQVHDRFREDERRRRRWVGGLSGTALASLLGVVSYFNATVGYHAVEAIPTRRATLSGSIGFLDDDRTLYHVEGDDLSVWTDGVVAAHGMDPAAVRFVTRAESASGRRLVVASPYAVSLLDLDRRTSAALFELPEAERSGDRAIDGLAVTAGHIAFTVAGRLWTGTIEGGLREAPRPTVVVHRGMAPFEERRVLEWGSQLTWSAEGRWLASATPEGALVVIRPQEPVFLDTERTVVYETRDTRPIGAMAFLPRGRGLVFTEGSLGFRELDLDTRAVRVVDLPAMDFVRDLQLRADGRVLVAATSTSIEVIAVDADSLAWRGRVLTSPERVTDIRFSPSGRTLAATYFDARRVDLYRHGLRLFGVDVASW